MGAKKKENPPPKPDKEKISKTPQPMPEKSTLNTKTKNESDNFHLWIPAPLENLEVQISSRKRILETLDTKSENIDAEIKQNLLIRDQQINVLNKTILNLRNDLKSKEEHYKQSDYEGKIANLRKELTEIRKDKDNFEDNLGILKQEYETAQANWEDERDLLMLQQESLVEEQQGMTSRLVSKDQEIKSMKEDIVQMSKIVHEMTGINQELHSKIESLNEVSEELRKKYLFIQSKAEMMDEIEGKYQEMLERANKNANFLENAGQKVNKDVEMLMKMMSEFEETMMMNSEKSSASQKYYKILEFIENMKNLPQEMLILSQEFSKTKLLPLSSQYENTEKKEKFLQIKISDLSTSLERHKNESSLTISSLKKMTDAFKNHNYELIEKNTELLSEIEKKDMEIYKLRAKVQHLTAKINALSKKNKEIITKEEDYKRQIKVFQNKITEIGEEQKSESNNINIREKRIRSVLGQIQVLREEIFNKDTEILKKAKEILKLEGFLEELKGQIQKMNSKIKESDAEMLKGVSKEIEAKDKHISMLKEMLRSTNMEMKAKDSIIGHYKRKHISLNMSIN